MKKTLWLAALVAVGLLATTLVALAASGAQPGMGPMTRVMRPAMHGYYDGHKDTFLNTDVSDRAQARQMHINFSAALARVPMSATPELYLFEGPAAAGQLPVFASEPGEPNYSPLWHEAIVSWASGVTPTLLKSDTEVEAAIKTGDLTEKEGHIVLNCPIVKVGR